MAQQRWQTHSIPSTRPGGHYVYLKEDERSFSLRASEPGTTDAAVATWQVRVEQEVSIDYSSVDDAIIALRTAGRGLVDAVVNVEKYDEYGSLIVRIMVEGWSPTLTEDQIQRGKAYLDGQVRDRAAADAQRVRDEQALLVQLAKRYPQVLAKD